MEYPHIEVYGKNKMKTKLLKKFASQNIFEEELRGISTADLKWLVGKAAYSELLQFTEMIIAILQILIAMVVIGIIHVKICALPLLYQFFGTLFIAISLTPLALYVNIVLHRRERLFFNKWKRSPFYQVNSSAIQEELEKRNIW